MNQTHHVPVHPSSLMSLMTLIRRNWRMRLNNFPDWYRWSAKQKWQHVMQAYVQCNMMRNRLRARGALMRQCDPVIMDAGERIHDYHTVNEDDGSMLISVSRETNHHGNNVDIENKSSEPDENEKERQETHG